MTARILGTPQFTLDTIFGTSLVLVPRAAPTRSDFLRVARSGRPGADFMTGSALTIMGQMPLLCSCQVTTRRCLDLLGRCGLPADALTLPYGDTDEYYSLIRRHAGRGRLVVQHRHPPEDVGARDCWVDPDLLSYLNDKSSLAALVPEEHLPRRTVHDLAEVGSIRVVRATPFVLKGVTPWSTGAGAAVAIVRCQRDLRQGLTRLAGCRAVVVEEYLALERTWCLHYATDGSTIRYLGAAEQVTDERGKYLGNWLEPGLPAPMPMSEIGREIMRLAAEKGYSGVAGFDIGMTSDGRILVLDLNFRLCGSTAAVAWYPSILAAMGGRTVARLMVLKSRRSFTHAAGAIAEAAEAGAVVPLSCYDPQTRRGSRGQPRFRLLVLGADRDEVERNRSLLVAAMDA